MGGYIGSRASVTVTSPETDSRYVNVTGDTMTGALLGTDLTLSGGVYLGGTGAANKLDDYETGTWTPALTAQNGFTGTPSTSSTKGKYVKIGSLVTLEGELEFASPEAHSSYSYISGLPFTVADQVNGAKMAGVYSTIGANDGFNPGGVRAGINSTQFSFLKKSSDTTVTNTTWIFSFKYFTDA